MKKLDFPALIEESVGELQKRERSEKEARIRWRVQLLRVLKNREADSIKAACQICGITPKHGYALWKKYREQGFERYLQLDWQPRRSKLSEQQQAQLLARAATKNGFGSQTEALAYLQSEFAVGYTQGGVSLLFQRLKIKAKAPRSRNTNAPAEAQAAYKKTLPRD